ncbi:uncharacterized protein LOC124489987 [Dermatophagoides farinae]|uniref:Uncharacterized protein n=1 Tax=Dermatophagoides farinae TaxID=6954 RepID=A0A922L6U9_DERFA|nr:uncharacterized protein LOC124489987 [Dermatophagoides farinae]KAH7639329.1 hypothetical protein HUG17_3362 [Dermatophagoides farinae]KAH9522084.1 hypothetical protein DERF_005687 [Dermatophagoides farinae]
MDDGEFMVTSITEMASNNYSENDPITETNYDQTAVTAILSLSDQKQSLSAYDETLPLAERNLYIMDKNNQIVPLASIRQILSNESLKHNIHGPIILESLHHEQQLNINGEIGGTTLPDKEMNEFTRIICDYIIVLFSEYPVPNHLVLFARMIAEEFPRLGPEELWFCRADHKAGIMKHSGKLSTRLENQRKPYTYKKRRLRIMGPDGQPTIEHLQPVRPSKVKLRFFNSQGQSVHIEGLSMQECTSNNNNNSKTETVSSKRLNNRNKQLNNQHHQRVTRNQSQNGSAEKAIVVGGDEGVVTGGTSVTMSSIQDDNNDENGANDVFEIYDDNHLNLESQITIDGSNDNINDKSNHQGSSKKNDKNGHYFHMNDKPFEIHVKRPTSSRYADDSNDDDDDDEERGDSDCCEKCGARRHSNQSEHDSAKPKKKKRGRGGGFKIVLYCYPLDD